MNWLRSLFRPRRVPVGDAMAEREDTLAYLDRRIANAEAVAGNSSPSEGTREEARVAVRQLRVVRDDIAAGMHEGEAEGPEVQK